jgi:hypothetical protein
MKRKNKDAVVQGAGYMVAGILFSGKVGICDPEQDRDVRSQELWPVDKRPTYLAIIPYGYV